LEASWSTLHFLARDREEDQAFAGVRRQLSIFAVALAVILIGLGYMVLQRGFSGNSAAGSPSVVATEREQVSNELLETTKGLQVTQQQAVDQLLQVVQDQLLAQKAETKKLSEQITAVTEKLDALKQSGAETPAPVAAPVSPPKSRYQ
jgi:hypothetical protein